LIRIQAVGGEFCAAIEACTAGAGEREAAPRQRTEALLTAFDARLAAMQKAGDQRAPSP